MKSMRIPANGIELFVEEHSTAGEALLLLPYQGGQTVMWQDIIPRFTPNYRVIALDLRGFGHSDQPESGYTLDIMAEDLRAVLDHLGIDKAHFVGNSLGGDAATCFAAKYPERALSLVNIEAALNSDTDPGARFHGMTREEAETMLRTQYPQATYASREEYEQKFRQWEPWNLLKERAVAAAVLRETEDGRVAPKQTTAQRFEIFHDIFGRDWMEYYAKIQCPVLFMPCDQEAELLPQKFANIERYSAGLPFHKTVVIPNSEHLMTFDHSDEVADEVLRFFEEAH
ncbi:alpha/beta fold hydrolase [Tumebacillus flagellatus]|uniref:AB hydrolase-1 domain-containing protein n=1 Tax=Tumebacillus flagellatus TaxID=1157490 RepID=A0A074LNC2_9BACL|nr:alpha/beta hydrolase [Tumebacillus flagellatus]KEO83601.1 hypothetical protein EL26_09320 [Tumebacillus flagellatus]